jgi:hypothetical protein
MTVLSLSFIISFVGLISVFGLKHWGIGNENVLYKKVRTNLDRRTVNLVEDLQKIPYAGRSVSSQVFHRILYQLSKLALHVVRFIERRLHRFVNMVKGKGDVNNQKGSASLFLKSIKERHRVGEDK